MWYGSGTSGRCSIGDGQMLRVHSPGNSTSALFLREITSWRHLESMTSRDQKSDYVNPL